MRGALAFARRMGGRNEDSTMLMSAVLSRSHATRRLRVCRGVARPRHTEMWVSHKSCAEAIFSMSLEH